MANSTWQYEQPRCPDGWDSSERRFYNRLIQVLDDIYAKYGRIDERMLSKGVVNRIDNSTSTAFDKIAAGLEQGKIAVDSLEASFAYIVSLTAKYGEFDFATIKNLIASALVVDKGQGDYVHITNFAATYAQMVNATIGNLVIKSSDGGYYELDVSADGTVQAKLVAVSDAEILAGATGSGKPIVGTQISAETLDAATVAASLGLFNKITASMIDTETLIAREAFIDALTTSQAFITKLTTSNIIGGKSLTIIAGEAEGAASAAKNAVKTYRQESAPDVADGVKNGDLWIKPSTGAISQADAIEFVLDENGDLYLNHGSGDGHSARFASGDPSMLETTFAMTLNADGEIISMPVTWMLVQDQTLANRINSNATTKVDVEYALGDSNTVAPTTDWTTTAPAQTQGQYIWSRTVTYFGDGTKSTGAASCLSTSLGKGISQIIEQYAVSGNAETAPTDGWSETAPTASANQYIWTRSEIVYVDGSKSHTPPQVQAKRYADILTDNLLDKVDGKTTVFYDPNEPETPNEGDLWYDTDADPVTIQRYSSGAWVEVTDSMLKKALDAAGEAKYIADKKIVTFAQDEAPTSGMSEGDLWIDTNDGNRLHRYNGTAWVAYQDESIEDVRNELSNAISDTEGEVEAAGKLAEKAVNAIGSIPNYVEITSEGLFLKDLDGASTLKVNSGSVTIGTNVGEAEGFSQLAANYVQFGDYQLRRATGGGLVFRKA